jgi:hypothetical protein
MQHGPQEDFLHKVPRFVGIGNATADEAEKLTAVGRPRLIHAFHGAGAIGICIDQCGGRAGQFRANGSSRKSRRQAKGRFMEALIGQP